MVVTLLSSLVRKCSLPRRLRLLDVIGRLPALGFDPMGYRRIGPLRIGLDVRDLFQREMLLNTYELGTSATLQSILRPGDTYVDIGTQVGFTAAIAAAAIGPTGRLVLVEPDPVALDRMESHIEAARGNPMLPRIDVVRAACSDKAGTLQFHISPILGHSRILHPGEEIHAGRITEVPVRTADDILAELGVTSIRLLKIDTEGHELAVLNGLQATLAAGRVEAVHIEKNPFLFDESTADTRRLHALIAQHGMTAYHEDRKVWVSEETLSSDECVLENWVFLRSLDIIPAELLPPEKPPVFAKDYLSVWASRAQNLEMEARGIVRQVKAGDLAGGICRAEEYLASHPNTDWLRGHLAWWYKSSGDPASALRHYQVMAERNTEDDALRAHVESLGEG